MIQYLLSSSICLAIVLGAYQCFLSKEAMYQFNRFYLILGLIAAFGIPLLIIQKSIEVLPNVRMMEPVETMNIVAGAAPDTVIDHSNSINYLYYILVLIAIISIGFLIRFLYNILSLAFRISRNRIEAFDGYSVVLLPSSTTPYVFWNYIFVNGADYEDGRVEEVLLTHEVAHARGRHSLDVIVMELLQILFWFNPILYFYKRAIQLNHEFIADKYVLNRHKDVRSYQSFLLQKAQGKREHALVSNLNFYITKQRLKMMTKTTSVLRASAYSLVVAAFFVCLTLSFSKSEAQTTNDSEFIPNYNMDKDKYYQNVRFIIPHDDPNTEYADSAFVGYSWLSLAQRRSLPDPPTNPDGTLASPLEDYTPIRMWGDPIPPPPPAPPAPPSAPDALIVPPAPPLPPAPPSPIEYIDEMMDLGAVFIFNSRKITYEDVRNFPKQKLSNLWILTRTKDGKYYVFLKE